MPATSQTTLCFQVRHLPLSAATPTLSQRLQEPAAARQEGRWLASPWASPGLLEAHRERDTMAEPSQRETERHSSPTPSSYSIVKSARYTSQCPNASIVSDGFCECCRFWLYHRMTDAQSPLAGSAILSSSRGDSGTRAGVRRLIWRDIWPRISSRGLRAFSTHDRWSRRTRHHRPSVLPKGICKSKKMSHRFFFWDLPSLPPVRASTQLL